MTGQMCWLGAFGSEDKILHLRSHADRPWIPYTESHLAVPDYNIPGGSKGMATYHRLYKAGWEVVLNKDTHRLTLVLPKQDAA